MRPALAAAAAAAKRPLLPITGSVLFLSTRMRSVEQAAREGTATGTGKPGSPLRSPDAPRDPADLAQQQGDEGGGDKAADAKQERDARISHAGGGFGPAIIQQNLADRERGTGGEGGGDGGGGGRPASAPGRVDPTKTPPAMDVPTEKLPHPFTEQLPHAARVLRERFAEGAEYLMRGEEGRRVGDSASRHGAVVEVAGGPEAVAHETQTQGMPPLGEADPLHKKLAEEMRRREGI